MKSDNARYVVTDHQMVVILEESEGDGLIKVERRITLPMSDENARSVFIALAQQFGFSYNIMRRDVFDRLDQTTRAELLRDGMKLVDPEDAQSMLIRQVWSRDAHAGASICNG